MVVTVIIHGDVQARPVGGSPIRVQVRDTSLADAPAIVVGEAAGTVQHLRGDLLGTVHVTVPELPRHATIWVHIDVDRNGKVSKGDHVTVVSYPVPATPDPNVHVVVKKV